MSFLQQQLFQVQERVKTFDFLEWMDRLQHRAPFATAKRIQSAKKQLFTFHGNIKLIGSSVTMDEYEKRKLGIFNQLNFFQLVSGICIPMAGIFNHREFPEWAWLVATMPSIISLIVLWLNASGKYETSIILYFTAYPVVSSMVYLSGINVGIDLFFILYGILSVFFLQQISKMLFSVSLSMISYFMLAVVFKHYRYQLESTNLFLYLFNQAASIVFIFYGLFLIKRENAGYQSSILLKNQEIEEKASLLQKQTVELTELNAVKSKLFSIIAHDLKTPMYSLRNMFRAMQHQKLTAKEFRAMLPDVINNLNYTTGLMDNLLQWAKSQMQSAGPSLQPLALEKMITDSIQLLQLPAAAKELYIEASIEAADCVKADKDMIDLVIRNLLSNAIKFTPLQGHIVIGTEETATGIEVYVSDTGRGMSSEALIKINRNDYFSTNGTAHEPGTGLGLMLCKEFLFKNGSELVIRSEAGQGSRFSFTLPLTEPQ